MIFLSYPIVVWGFLVIGSEEDLRGPRPVSMVFGHRPVFCLRVTESRKVLTQNSKGELCNTSTKKGNSPGLKQKDLTAGVDRVRRT